MSFRFTYDNSEMIVLSRSDAAALGRRHYAALDHAGGCANGTPRATVQSALSELLRIMVGWQILMSDLPSLSSVQLPGGYAGGAIYPSELYLRFVTALGYAEGSSCDFAQMQIPEMLAQAAAIDAAWSAAYSDPEPEPTVTEPPTPPAPIADPVEDSDTPLAQAARGEPLISSSSSKIGMAVGIAAILVGGAILWGTVKK